MKLVVSVFALLTSATAAQLGAQTSTGAVAGVVRDAAHRPLSGAIVQVIESHVGKAADENGTYRLDHIPAGAVRMVARIPGYTPDTASVTILGSQTVAHDFALRPTNVTLETVTIVSPRMNETKAAALQEQKTSDLTVSVLSGDEIRSLPNANAAEAAARIPGVTSERDEGEGKFVEIRGTPPQFTNVMIDGVHVPGTLSGDRSVKLDDIPSDLLGAIEVSKTLTADMEADAIGGTVNLVSKIPEGSPRGYIAGQYSHQTLEANSQGQGSLTYGGRVGPNQKIGFLLGGSYDRTNRTIQDVEPTFAAENVQGNTVTPVDNGSGFNHVYPNDWSQREYNYYRTRYGINGDLDYRFSPTSTVYLRGLWSAFFDQANRWVTEVAAGNDVPGKNTVTGASVSNEVSNRGPVEHTWGLIGGGKHNAGIVHLDYSGNWTGSSATTHNHFDDKYDGTGGGLGAFNYSYAGSSPLVPRYTVLPAVAGALETANNYTFNKVSTSNEAIDGQDFGGQANALIPFSLGSLPATFKFGAKYSNEHKADTPDNGTFTFNGTTMPTLANFPSQYSLNNFYGHICPGCYINAPFGSIPSVNRAIAGNSNYSFATDNLGNLQSAFAGTEQIASAYAMGTVNVDRLHINAGLRVENTAVSYVAHVDTTQAGASTASQLNTLHNQHSYTNVFPSVLLRYSIDDNTNVRAAFTRGISRPNYSDLAPTFAAANALRGSFTSAISAGNSALLPEYSWNTDFLVEHYFPSVGVISGGVFYKDISNFIFSRTVRYTGQVANVPQLLPDATGSYFISQPQNGPHAFLYGAEADYTQHLTFLPGALRGIGFDANWTWVYSRATVPMDTTIYSTPFRHAPLPRQFPNIFNVALLYDYSSVSARLAGQYTAASIFQYNADGTSNPESGDTYNYPHWQIDGSIVWTVFGQSALQAQVLNLNNAVFGFFNGTTGHPYNLQRELYGTTLFIGVRQGF